MTSTTTLPPITLLRPSALLIPSTAPLILEINIPIPLPHHLDPSLPPPPYHNRPGGLPAEFFRDDHAFPLTRALLTKIISHLLGPTYPGALLDVADPRTTTCIPGPGDLVGLSDSKFDFLLVASWECDAVTDKKDFDFEGGWWRDQYGVEHRRVVQGFIEVPGIEWIEVYNAFRYYLVRGVWEVERLEEVDPRVPG
ncbi:hypothetical protein VTK56DRAFT_8874 [Thermocarpiscus australiensis]